jgi:hypothetical protein
MDEELLKRLISTVRCFKCGGFYVEDHARVLGYYGDTAFLSVYCSECRRRDIVAAVVKEVSVADLDGDTVGEQQAKFRYMIPVSEGDVQAIHDFLEGFDGDFSLLFTGSKD